MKVLKTFLLLLFCGFLPFSCECPDQKKFYENIESVGLTALNADLSETDTINGDTLKIRVVLETTHELVASIWSFTATSYATTPCDGDISLGLKDKIDSISISSDTVFNGLKANTSLNTLASFKSDYFEDGYQNAIDQMNEDYYRETVPSLLITLPKKSTESLNQKFRVQIFTKSGVVFSGETEKINWK